jgi:hypothetical protein
VDDHYASLRHFGSAAAWPQLCLSRQCQDTAGSRRQPGIRAASFPERRACRKAPATRYRGLRPYGLERNRGSGGQHQRVVGRVGSAAPVYESYFQRPSVMTSSSDDRTRDFAFLALCRLIYRSTSHAVQTMEQVTPACRGSSTPCWVPRFGAGNGGLRPDLTWWRSGPRSELWRLAPRENVLRMVVRKGLPLSLGWESALRWQPVSGATHRYCARHALRSTRKRCPCRGCPVGSWHSWQATAPRALTGSTLRWHCGANDVNHHGLEVIMKITLIPFVVAVLELVLRLPETLTDGFVERLSYGQDRDQSLLSLVGLGPSDPGGEAGPYSGPPARKTVGVLLCELPAEDWNAARKQWLDVRALVLRHRGVRSASPPLQPALRPPLPDAPITSHQ